MANLKALIPLDGTKLAESTLALLPFLKILGVGKVELITVWESGWEGKEALEGRDEKEMPELGERGHAFASAYLDSVRPRVIDLGLEVETTVRLGRPTDEILDAASDEGVDLILIATHGRDGLERFRLGSTADKVIRGAKCPTLVIGPNVNTDLAPLRAQESLCATRWLGNGRSSAAYSPLDCWPNGCRTPPRPGGFDHTHRI